MMNVGQIVPTMGSFILENVHELCRCAVCDVLFREKYLTQKEAERKTASRAS